MTHRIAKRECHIKAQKAEINRLNDLVNELNEDNKYLRISRGQSSGNKRHKQTRTAHLGEDIISEGRIRYPSPSVIEELRKMKEKQLTQKYVDPNGEERKLPMIKLKSNMYTAIRRRLSKRFQIRRIYTQGQGTKVDWIAEPKNQRITRSMRAKCLSTLYNCCKYGVLHWPDTDNEFDSEDTDKEELERLIEAGHSDNPVNYAHIMPELTIWQPFMAKLKK